MVSLCDLSCTEVLLPALSFCDALSLAGVRTANRTLAGGLPSTSPLWAGLLRLSGARLAGNECWLQRLSPSQSDMAQCLRLASAVARCTPRLARDDALDDQAGDIGDRHRLVVSGARGSGISTLVRMMCRGPQQPNQAALAGARSDGDLEVYNLRAELGGTRVKASVVDKRSTAITTPLSASLYQGNTALAFVFDADRAEASLVEAAKCIRDVHHTVGDAKFEAMPKLLVCHKAELLQAPGIYTEGIYTCFKAESFPPMCGELLSMFGMHLVLTTFQEQASVDLLFALASEQWPRRGPVAAGAKEIPAITADDPEHTFTSVGTRARRMQPRAPASMLEELQAVRRRAE